MSLARVPEAGGAAAPPAVRPRGAKRSAQDVEGARAEGDGFETMLARFSRGESATNRKSDRSRGTARPRLEVRGGRPAASPPASGRPAPHAHEAAPTVRPEGATAVETERLPDTPRSDRGAGDGTAAIAPVSDGPPLDALRPDRGLPDTVRDPVEAGARPGAAVETAAETGVPVVVAPPLDGVAVGVEVDVASAVTAAGDADQNGRRTGHATAREALAAPWPSMPDGDARPRPSLPFAGLGVPTQPDAQAVLVEPGPDMPGGGEPWLDAGLAMAEAIADVPFDAAEGLDAAAPSPADTAIADAVLASFDQAADAHPGGSQGERGSEAGQGRAAPFDGAAIAFGERLLQTAAPEALAATDAVQAAADEAAEGGVDRQIVQAMRVQWRGGLGEATITLRPEYLGQVRISLRLEGGALQAHLQVEDPHVRAWVESHADLLKGGLAGQGLDLERLVVSDQPDSARRETPDEDRTRRGRRPRPGSSAEALGGPRFEVEA